MTDQSIIRRLTSSRFVLWHLALREIRVRYKQSVLGAAWAVLVPTAMMLTFTLVFTHFAPVVQSLNTRMPYPLFVYLGLLPWMLFAQGLTQAANSLVANRNLVTKIYFPREVFPLSSILSALFDFAIASSVLIVLIVYYSLTLEAGVWTFMLTPSILWLPVILFVQLSLMAGLAMWLSMAHLFYRDVKYVLAVGLQIWMFLTNVIYPLPTSGTWGAVLTYANPMTPIIGAYRSTLIHGQAPDPGPFLCATVMAAFLLASGHRAFRASEHRFAECV